MSQTKDILTFQIFDIIKKHGIYEQGLFDELATVINDFHFKGTSEVKIPDIKKKIDLFLISKKIRLLAKLI